MGLVSSVMGQLAKDREYQTTMRQILKKLHQEQAQ